jgi:endonuclease/exonuclease/phosphatase family metal-dependent hydrolase
MARLMTLNVAHAAAGPIPPFMRRRATLERRLDGVAAAIAGAAPDIVALQEIDRPTFFSKHIDHFARVAGASGMHAIHSADRVAAEVHPRPGTALLSRAPLDAPRACAFQVWPLDDKSFVAGTVVLGGAALDVISVHLDPFSSAVRRRQIDAMGRALGPRVRPRVVMGDMNSSWRGDVERLASVLEVEPHEPHGAHRTFPAWRPLARIDWILASPEIAFTSYAVTPAIVSDHLGVVADVALRC